VQPFLCPLTFGTQVSSSFADPVPTMQVPTECCSRHWHVAFLPRFQSRLLGWSFGSSRSSVLIFEVAGNIDFESRVPFRDGHCQSGIPPLNSTGSLTML